MEFNNPFLPMRSVIRCKAKQRLMTGTDGNPSLESIDEDLLKEVAMTLFRSNQSRSLRESYPSRAAANEVEDWAATELAVSYRRITQQRQHSIVQNLNSLL